MGTWFRPDIEVDRRTQLRIERQIMILWAGPMAEARFTGAFDDEGADADLMTLTNLAVYASGGTEEAEAFIEWLRLRASGVLENGWVWPRVERVAAALLETPRISGRRFRNLLAEPTAEESEGLAQILRVMRLGSHAN